MITEDARRTWEHIQALAEEERRKIIGKPTKRTLTREEAAKVFEHVTSRPMGVDDVLTEEMFRTYVTECVQKEVDRRLDADEIEIVAITLDREPVYLAKEK